MVIKNITLAITLLCAPVTTHTTDYTEMTSPSAEHASSNCCCSQETQQSYQDMAKLFGGCRIAQDKDELGMVTACSTTSLICGLSCLTLPKATPALIATGVISTYLGICWGILSCIGCTCGTGEFSTETPATETTTLRTAPRSTAMTQSPSDEKLFHE